MNRQRSSLIAALALVIAVAAGSWWLSTTGPGNRATDRIGERIDPAGMLRAGAFRVSVDISPETPRVGLNTVSVRVADADGVPVDDARVTATAVMPAMGAMQEMRAAADIERTGSGRYEGRFSLSMEGSWPLSLTIEHATLGTARVEFDMATRRAGLELRSGAQLPPGTAPDPATADRADPPGTILIDARRRQLIGLRTDEVRRMHLRRTVRAVGRIAYDETRLTDVSLRFDAWIGTLAANYVGMPVTQGQMLFTVYGPELLSAQQEYLEIRRRADSGPVIEAARRRLELLGFGEAHLAALERRGTALDYVPIAAPRSGVVVESNVVAGSALRAGTTVMRLADLSQVWVEAQVYEADLALIETGTTALVTLPHLPEQRFEGRVEYVYPFLDARTRTARLRLSLPNPDGRLKSDMYAEVRLEADLGERLVVPVDAVIFAGENRYVFEDLGDGRLVPHRVGTGVRGAEHIEILPAADTIDGLVAGARVVSSGVFLIAAESRLQGGLEQW
jgi:membrane fusion protein, copper/silver efflux system